MYSQPNPAVNAYFSKPRNHGLSEPLKIQNGNTMQPKSLTVKGGANENTKKMKKIVKKFVFDSTSGIDSMAVLFIHTIVC